MKLKGEPMMEMDSQKRIAALQQVWLAAASKALTEAFGAVFEVGGSSAARPPRPLGVQSDFLIGGDFQGRLAFGVPAASREFTTLLLSGKTGGSQEETWNRLSQKIADLWLEMLPAEAGLTCTIERLDSGAGLGMEADPASPAAPAAAKQKRKGRQAAPKAEQEAPAGDAPTGNMTEQAALFSTLKSDMIELPVYLTVRGEAAEAREKGFQRGAPRKSEDDFGSAALPASKSAEAANLDLLLDIELQASLRFGGREMPLGEILELGPGDVVSLDRPVDDPIDLVVGDRIVARGEVVLIDGCYGMRVLEVAEPRKRLETVRCLF